MYKRMKKLTDYSTQHKSMYLLPLLYLYHIVDVDFVLIKSITVMTIFIHRYCGLISNKLHQFKDLQKTSADMYTSVIKTCKR